MIDRRRRSGTTVTDHEDEAAVTAMEEAMEGLCLWESNRASLGVLVSGSKPAATAQQQQQGAAVFFVDAGWDRMGRDGDAAIPIRVRLRRVCLLSALMHEVTGR